MILDVLGEVLPLAVGVAISPIPIVAAILMLLSRDAGAASLGFGLGWVAGIFSATGLLTFGARWIDPGDGQPSAAASWVKIGLGVVLVALAIRQWRSRADTSVPGWMRAIDGLTAVKAAGLGLALSAINPKNLLLCVSAGVAIGTAGLGAGEQVVTVALFTVLAAVSVLVPVVGYAVAADRLRGPLDATKNWLQANNHAVLATLLLVMGAVVLGKGLSGL